MPRSLEDLRAESRRLGRQASQILPLSRASPVLRHQDLCDRLYDLTLLLCIRQDLRISSLRQERGGKALRRI